MRCPYCGWSDSKVIDSRPAEDGEKIRRRRECIKCHKRFTTYESIEKLPIVVVKKDNSRELFDKQKIVNGLIRACEKRPVPLSRMNDIADQVESELQNSYEKEVSSRRIGELVMDKLKDIDEVAYVRFASVYRQFRDINSFMDELSSLIDKKKDQ